MCVFMLKITYGINNTKLWCVHFLLALPTKAKDIAVFRFIIEYSSLRDFGPLRNNNRFIFYMRFFEKMIFLACVETWD
jgi:hypothetical protein